MSGKPTLVISHSEAKAYKHCQQLHDYRFRRGLEPRLTRRPLKLGTWVHFCLQHHYDKSGWRGALDQLIEEDWKPLFDEERVYYGDLPGQTAHLMTLYEWYYKVAVNDEWELVLPPEVPIDFTYETPQYIIRFLGRIDLVIRDSAGRIWAIDHKTSSSIPNDQEPKTFQAMDTQLTFYPWALKQQYGIEAFGTMYNYIRSKAPTVPHMNQDKVIKKTGEIIREMSRAKIDTDILTFLAFCKEHDVSPEEFPEQFDYARENTPSFFYRARVPRDRKATASTMTDLINTAIAKSRYRTPLRNVTMLCRQCEMLELCEAEYFGMDTTGVLQKYKQSDNPYSYLNIFEEVS